MEQATALVDTDATTQYYSNVFETKARMSKAAKLADVLLAQGITSEQVHAIPIQGRLIAAAVAGVRRPSPLTWLVVAELLDAVERSAALDAADPDDLRYA